MESSHFSYSTIKEYIEAAVDCLVIPIIYFDTNVYIDIIFNRDANSVQLYEFAIQNDWECVTSIFAKVETLEMMQKDQYREMKEMKGWKNKRIINGFSHRDLPSRTLEKLSHKLNKLIRARGGGFRNYCSIQDIEGCQEVESIKRTTNLTDKDSIHLAEARAIACDIMISKDRHLVEIASNYLWVIAPDTLNRIISKSS